VDPDRALVEQARTGRDDAFAELVARYQVRMFNLARALTGNDADADDLAQEVFVRIYRGLGGFRGDSSFRTWLYRVAVNVIRSHLGRRPWFGFLRRDEAGAAGADADEVAAPGNIEDAMIRRDAIDRALRGLPRDQRVAVALRDVQGLEYAEIAEVTGVPIGTVMSRIARGRARLRPVLAPLVGRQRTRPAVVAAEAPDVDL
jgi:RNA polymerase sigma-70 factor (ECF subfamily)